MHGNWFDVAVIGGGPAGATAAALLARGGATVALLDKARFPRDKSCGDAVCSKSIGVLAELGVLDEIARRVHVRVPGQVFATEEAAVRVPFGAGAKAGPPAAICVAREIFDDVLFQHAKGDPRVTALEGHAFLDFIRERGRIAGVIAQGPGGRTHEIRARVVIGADGAMSRVADKARAYDFQRKDHDHWIGAFRSYYDGVTGLGDEMEIHFLDELLPGYFWIFPVGDGRANVGAGMVESYLTGRRGGQRIQLRRRVAETIGSNPKLRARFAEAREVAGTFRGWQIPCGSERRPLAGDGWMLVGDAASLVDPFSGEGIANAMVSGKLAAEHALVALGSGAPVGPQLRRYERAIWATMGSELDTSYRMQRLARHGWLLRFVLRRAARSPRVRDALAAAAADPSRAKELVSPLFYLKLLLA